MPINFEKYNEDVKGWGRSLVADAKKTGLSQGITHSSDSPSKSASLPKIKDKYSYDTGAINKVAISFPRSLIYTMKGAGKGIGGRKGSRWITAKGETKKTNPKSLNKIGTSGRRAKDFINQSLDANTGVERLADIAAIAIGAVVSENLYIK